ncbi:unnamed protein product [Orchesella dallaii]|uniref:Uncharacterized protein n=1 Tax=Orchesella dallaii TaxID=48710 RepID=A0ABP1RNZ1_9HEXA
MDPVRGEEYYNIIYYLMVQSCPYLQTIFLERYNYYMLTCWSPTETHGMEVVKCLGLRIAKSLKTEQWNMIITGSFDAWDLPTCSLVLNNFGCEAYYKTVNEAVKTLHRIWTEVTNSQKKMLRRETYHNMVKKIRQSFQSLGLPNIVCNTLIAEASIISYQNLTVEAQPQPEMQRNEYLKILFQNDDSPNSVKKTVNHIIKSTRRIHQIIRKETDLTEQEKREVVNKLYNCVKDELIQLVVADDVSTKLKEMLSQMYLISLKTSRKSRMDMKVRYCSIVINEYIPQDHFVTLSKCIEQAKEALRKYPKNACFYQLLGNLHLQTGEVKMIKRGLYCVKMGLKRLPHHVALLHYQAIFLHTLCYYDKRNFGGGERVTQAYEKFIQAAPIDHPKVPDAYYGIVCLYNDILQESVKRIQTENRLMTDAMTDYQNVLVIIRKTIEYYQLGIEAEEKAIDFVCPLYTNFLLQNEKVAGYAVSTLEKKVRKFCRKLRFCSSALRF